ncbi:serine-rich adhesin for platelets-like isoform X3 [Symsagittifera roscoffensis]|uniref:serine-rich adhesin for platelets-like isoform X3 n=1 Tax=Symsagittifera roscoffensis TaxID=84072 RepID=UPI00307C6D4E
MRSETNYMKSADQEKSKPHHREKRRERSTSPTYDHHRRRSSPSDDDDLSHIYPVKSMISQVAHEHEDDPEIYNGEGEDYISDTDYMVQWTGPRKNLPVVLFRADAILEKESSAKCVGEKYRLAFKIVRTECKIVRSVLVSHGFHEVHPNSLDFNVMWTGSHIKPYVLRGFSEFQKVNHFPRSYELTRKDRLCKNVQRMQHLRGFKHFDFIPLTFITPIEFGDFQSTFAKEKGVWIVKPVASSRGRGIFLINHPSQVPMDETLIVSRYINNPLLIDDFKFDIRIYVLVTSYDPLIVYLYEEGLARFASQKFDKSTKSVKNQFMHLTNYSVNKRNPDFVKNADPELEDFGNKWSMSAMLRYLKSIGHDTATLMMRIEDLVVKTFLAGEMAIASASNMFQPHRGNCYELYGFDVLVDENMKPWLMEVNLSPSLACDAPIDLKIKANMISDLFSVVGVTAQDPVSRRINGGRREFQSRSAVRQQQPYNENCRLLKQRPANSGRGGRGGGAPFAGGRRGGGRGTSDNSGGTPLTGEEAKILRMAREEYGRRGRWIRVFPTHTSWETYGGLMEHRTTHNLMLYTKLYPNNGRTKSGAPSRPPSSYHSSHRPKSAVPMYSFEGVSEGGGNGYSCEIISRLLQYERRLLTLAESRAVSAAHGNRRVHSENVALSLSAATSQSAAATNADHNSTHHYASAGAKAASNNHHNHHHEKSQSRSRSQMSNGAAGGQNRANSRPTSNDSSRAHTTNKKDGARHHHQSKSEKEKSRSTKSVGQDTGGDEHLVQQRGGTKTTTETSGNHHVHGRRTREKGTEPMGADTTGGTARHGHRSRKQQQQMHTMSAAVYNVSADYTRSRSRSSGSPHSAASSSRSNSGSGRSQGNDSAGSPFQRDRCYSRSRSQSASSSSSGCSGSLDSGNDDSNGSSVGMSSAQQAKEQLRCLLEQGHIFTVTQARLAFAAYLARVHQRLLQESQQHHSNSSPSSAAAVDALSGQVKREVNENGSDAQMDTAWDPVSEDLVLRFLRRAAQNLSQVFRVVVPSKKLPIQDRRRILAKQLSDFVSIYSKDTHTISARENKTAATQQEHKIPISDQIFQQFLDLSNENDLEEVLTLFTKINKSASIFLGGIQQLAEQQKDLLGEQNNQTSSADEDLKMKEKRKTSTEKQSSSSTAVTLQPLPTDSVGGAVSDQDGGGRRRDHVATSQSDSKGDHEVRMRNEKSGGSSHCSQQQPGSPENRERQWTTAATVGLALHQHSSANTPLGDKMMLMEEGGFNHNHKATAASRRRPPSGAVTTATADVSTGTGLSGAAVGSSSRLLVANGGQRDRSVERRDRSVERELFLHEETTSTRVQKPTEASAAKLAFDTNSSGAAGSSFSSPYRNSRLAERPGGSGSRHYRQHRPNYSPIGQGGAPFMPSSSCSRSPSASPHSRSREDRGGGSGDVWSPSASGDATASGSIRTSTSRSTATSTNIYSSAQSQSEANTTLTPASVTRSSITSSRNHSAKGSGATTSGTPMNRGKKPRPFSAQLDAAARIYCENLTKTMVPISNNRHHGRSNTASSKWSSTTNYNNNNNSTNRSESGSTTITTNKSEQAISDALQRLAKRHATRQYSANNASSALLGGTSSADTEGDQNHQQHNSKSNGSHGGSGHFAPHRWEKEGHEELDAHASAYSHVTGVAPSASYQATPGSTQYEVVQQQSATRSSSSSAAGILNRPTTSTASGTTSTGTGTAGSGLVQQRQRQRPQSCKTSFAALNRRGQQQGSSSSAVSTIENEESLTGGGASGFSRGSSISLSMVPQAATSNSHAHQPHTPYTHQGGYEDSPYYTRPTRASSASRRPKAAMNHSAPQQTNNNNR